MTTAEARSSSTPPTPIRAPVTLPSQTAESLTVLRSPTLGADAADIQSGVEPQVGRNSTSSAAVVPKARLHRVQGSRSDGVSERSRSVRRRAEARVVSAGLSKSPGLARWCTRGPGHREHGDASKCGQWRPRRVFGPSQCRLEADFRLYMMSYFRLQERRREPDAAADDDRDDPLRAVSAGSA